MADVTGTSGNDILFFNGTLQHLNTTITNAYSGESVLLDDDYNVNISSYEGLAGIDTLFMTNIGDALFIADGGGVQTLFNVEFIIAGDGGDVIDLSHNTITLGNIFIDGGRADDILWGNVGNDTIRGFDGNDIIDGGPGNDTLAGQNGNDIIAGGAGNDAIDGGANVDTASYAGSPAGAVVNLATGTASDGHGGTDTLTNIENVNGSAFDDTITGNAGANVLNGGGGNDILAGGAGNDTMNGGSATDTDTVSYAAAAASVIVDLGAGTASDGSGGTDTLGGIENVEGSAFDDTITGDDATNVLNGNAGSDLLDGAGDNDTLNGGAGADLLRGGAGNDILHFNADIIFDGGVMAANIGSPGIEGTLETKSANGTNGSFDVFDGGAGYDILAMTSGSDTLFLFDDNHAFHAAGSGLRLIDVEQVDAGDGNDIIDLTHDLYSYGDIVLNGGNGDDYLWSSVGNDTIDGGEGIDNLWGGVGNDILYGGAGDDRIVGGPDADSGAIQITTVSHEFNNTVIFPNVTESVSILDLVPPGTNALGIAAGDLSVDYSTTAEISFVKTVAGFNNTLGFYNIAQNGTIMSVELAFPNVKNFAAGATATINLPGAPDTDFGFFIIANGANKNNNFSSYDLVNGEFHFVYNHNKAGERLATIHDDAKDIELVYNFGAIEKTVVGKNQTYHTTTRGGGTNLNADDEVHVVSGLITDGDTTRLRIGFEDLPNLGDADYNDVVFDITVAGHSVETLVVDDSDILYGGAGNDILDGGVGDDILTGGEGADTLYGGHGDDRFVFDVMDGFADIVKDFETGPGGDVLDIGDILQGYDALNDAIGDFVRLVANGADTELQINADGDLGGVFAAVAIIEGGLGGAALADLINNGNLAAS